MAARRTPAARCSSSGEGSGTLTAAAQGSAAVCPGGWNSGLGKTLQSQAGGPKSAGAIAEGGGQQLQTGAALGLHPLLDLRPGGRQEMVAGGTETTADQHQLGGEHIDQRRKADPEPAAMAGPDRLGLGIAGIGPAAELS